MNKSQSTVSGLVAAGFALSLAACGGGSSYSSDNNDPPAANTPPTAEAGPAQTLDEGAVVQLAGAGSDAEGSVTYAWSRVSGPEVTLSDTAIADPTFVAPVVPIGTTATVVLNLTVSDSAGATANDEVTITIDSADFMVFRASEGDPGIPGLYVYDTKTAALTRLSEESPSGVVGDDDYFVSPNGEYVAYLVSNTPEEWSLHVARPDGSDSKPIVTETSRFPKRSVFWAPDSSRIAFENRESVEPFEMKIETIHPDGSGRVTLDATPDTESFLNFPRGYFGGPWAPDSSRIVFEERDRTTFSNELLTVRPDGTDLVSVASGFVDFLDWAPDGSRLAYQGPNSEDETHTIRPDGTEDVRVGGALVDSWFAYFAEWAPDSAQLIIEAVDRTTFETEFFIESADGANTRSLDLRPPGMRISWDFNGPSWAPDGSRFYYELQDLATGSRTLHTALPDGTGRMELINGGGSSARVETWSPDSAWLVWWDRTDRDTPSAFAVKADGSGVTDLGNLVPDGRLSYRGVSPDSQWVAIDRRSLDGTEADVYTVRLDGSAAHKINGAEPGAFREKSSGSSWSSDGSRIAYLSGDTLRMSTPDGAEQVDVMTVTGVSDVSWSP